MNFKNIFGKILFTALLTSVCLFSFGQNTEARIRYLSIGTNPVGMAWYTMGAALADVVRTEGSNIDLTVEATNGAVHNVQLMAMGDIEISLTSAKEAMDAYSGTGRYSKKVPILGLFSTSIAYSQCVALANSGIKSFDDIVGKRVGVGPGGSSTFVDNQTILETIGISYDKFNDFAETLPEAIEKMKNGQLHASLWFGNSPLGAIMDLAQSRDIVWFGLDEKRANELIKKYPYYFYSALPANTYTKQTEPVPTLAQRFNMIALADLDEQSAYEITKIAVENFDKLTAIYNGWESASKENVLQSMAIPLHPGAIRYYREINLPGIEEYIKKYPNK